MLEIIHQDHQNMNRLLTVLREKLLAIRQEQRVNYRIVRDIVVYLQSYSDKYHHPMEDILYDYYLKYRVVSDGVANRLQEDHHQLAIATSSLKEQLDIILLDAVVPIDQLCDQLDSFIKLQLAHLTYEEREVLPAIKNSLTEDDWRQLEQQWQIDVTKDPLFGRDIASQFQTLAKRIGLV